MNASKKTSVLVADDDPRLLKLVQRNLELNGYRVLTAMDGTNALKMAESEELDLLLLDIMMPGQDGLDVLECVRRASDVPVILLTAKGDEAHRVLGFRFGADDYVVKPFSTAELTGRIAAVLRRTTGGGTKATSDLRFDGLHIDPGMHKVTVHGREIELPAREYDLLTFLASSPQQVFSREELLERLWPNGGDRNPATVTEHVARIRRRIEDDPDRPRWVKTVRGVGYRFDP